MADVTAASLLASAVALFLLAREEPRAYPAAGFLAGLSAVAQQTALLLPAPALLTLLLARRRDLRSPWVLAGAVLFALPPAAWLLARGASGGSEVVWWWVLGPPKLDAVAHYLLATASFAGLPLLLLAAWGAPSARRTPEGRDLAVTLLGALFTVGGFFALAYDFRDQRFVAYLFPLLVLLAAVGISRLPSRAWKVAAAACAAAFALVPSWEPVAAVPRVVLWPLPAVDLTAAVRRGPVGDARVDLATLRVETRGVREVLRAFPWALAYRSRLAAAPPPPSSSTTRPGRGAGTSRRTASGTRWGRA
jgi:4-amino-4-deoxy-L-arabinose transferase-like glycosyltransferase